LLDAQQHAEVARVDEFVGVDALQGVDRADRGASEEAEQQRWQQCTPTNSSKVAAALTA
jgi:hypothetical protein